MSATLINIFEDCNLFFATIAPGGYPVGAAGEPTLAQPPQIEFFAPAMTPHHAISLEPLRWGHWHKMITQ